MISFTRLLGLSILFLSVITTNSVQATIIFDNTDSSSFSSFGPSCCHVGNEISLSDNALKVNQISWLIDSQNYDLTASIETRIYANDAQNGAPGTLIWNSGQLDVNVFSADTLLNILVPEITVPETFTVTSRFINSTPVALARLYVEPSSESVNTSWVETSTGMWFEQFGPWGMKISAVTVSEPNSLFLFSSLLFMFFKKRKLSYKI